MLKRFTFLWFLTLVTGITLWATPPEGGYLKVSDLQNGMKVTIGDSYSPNGYMNAVIGLSNGEIYRRAEIAIASGSTDNSTYKLNEGRFSYYPSTYGAGQSIWVLQAADVSDVENEADKANVYYLYNALTECYLGKCPESDKNEIVVPLATSKAEAGRYQITGKTLTIEEVNYGEEVYFRDIDNKTEFNTLYCGNSGWGSPIIKNHKHPDGGNWFFIREAPSDAKTLVMPDLANKEFLLTSKNLVSKNSDGTYDHFHLTYNAYVASCANQNQFVATDTVAGSASIWTFVPAGPQDTYYLMNKGRKVYVGKTNTSSTGQKVPYTTDKSEAGRYTVVDFGISEDAFGLRDYDNEVNGYLTIPVGWLTKTYTHNETSTTTGDDGEDVTTTTKVTDQTYKRFDLGELSNSALSIYAGDGQFVTERIVDYGETHASDPQSASPGEVTYPSVIDNSVLIHTAFMVETPHDASIYKVAPSTELYISPRAKFEDQGYLNLYDEMGFILGEKAENAWLSVWNLVPDDKYDAVYEDQTNGYKDIGRYNGMTEYKEKPYRANNSHNNWNLRLDKIKEDWPDEDGIQKLAYNLYNRSLKEYIAIVDGNVTLTKEQSAASEFYAIPSDDGNSVAFKTTIDNTVYYLTLDGSNKLAATTNATSEDNQFCLRDAVNTSYSGIFDGATVQFEPYRYDGSKLYLAKGANRIYRSTIVNGQPCDYNGQNPGFNPGGYKEWKLIQCYTSVPETSSDDSAESAPQRAASTAEEAVTDTYYIYNELAKMYVKKIVGTNHQSIELTTNVADAGKYTFYPDQEHQSFVVIKDSESTSGQPYLNVSATSTGGAYDVVTWMLDENNRLFYVDAVRENSESMMDYIYDGAYISMIPWLYKGENNTYYNKDGGNVYERDNGDGTTTLTCDYTSTIEENKTSELNTIWRIIEVKDAKDANGNDLNDVYYIVNEGTGEYLCKDENGNVVTRKLGDGDTLESINATQYQIIPDDVSGRFVVFKDIDSVTDDNKCNYLNTNVANTGKDTAVQTSDLWNTSTQPSGLDKSNWYYITPIDMENEINEDLLQWILNNLNPDNETLVGFFDATKNVYTVTTDNDGNETKKGFEGKVIDFTKTVEGTPYGHDPEYSVTLENLTPSKTETDNRQLTFLELVALVKYYYEQKQNGVEMSDTEKVEAQHAYEALVEAIENEEFIVHPRIGRFYQIMSAFPYYDGLALRETYYAKDFHEAQQTQRVYFHMTDMGNLDPEVVPSYWRFDQEGKKDGTDAEHYFFVRAVNSRDVLSLTANRAIVDSRADDNPDAAVYSLYKPYSLIVYPGAVILKSHYNNDARTSVRNKSYLGLYQDPTEGYMEATVREGYPDRIEATDGRPTENVQNWFIKEVKDVPIYFYNQSGEDDENTTTGGYYYNTFCFPFNVKVPKDYTEDLTVYTSGQSADYENGGTVIDLEPLEADANGDYVIKAFQPVIIENKNTEEAEYALDIIYGEGEEYGYEYNWYNPENKRYTESSKAPRRADEADDATETSDWSMTSIDYLKPYKEGEEGKSNTEISQIRFGESTLTGAVTPNPVSASTRVYVLHNDCNDSAELVIGGETYSFEPDDVNTSTLAQYPNMSLVSHPEATYIIPCNTAVLSARPNDDEPKVPVDTPDEGSEVISGVENVSVNATDEVPVWYDLQGYRINNPVDGNIYIRVTSTQTSKVIYRK